MAFEELEEARIRKAVAAYVERRRPPPHIRPELDIGFRIERQSVLLFETRSVWQGAPGEKSEQSIAKATYVMTSNCWRLYWMKSDLKWHGYTPHANASTIQEVLGVIERDGYGCFYG